MLALTAVIASGIIYGGALVALWTQQDTMKRILTSVTPQDTEIEVLVGKAFDVQNITACGRQGPKFWKTWFHPFDALLPVL